MWQGRPSVRGIQNIANFHRHTAQRWKTMIRNTNKIGKEESEHVSYNKKIKFIIRIKEEKLRAPANNRRRRFRLMVCCRPFLSWCCRFCSPIPSPVFLLPWHCVGLFISLLFFCIALASYLSSLSICVFDGDRVCGVSPKSQTVPVHTLGILLQICCKINISFGFRWVCSVDTDCDFLGFSASPCWKAFLWTSWKIRSIEAKLRSREFSWKVARRCRRLANFCSNQNANWTLLSKGFGATGRSCCCSAAIVLECPRECGDRQGERVIRVVVEWMDLVG